MPYLCATPASLFWFFGSSRCFVYKSGFAQPRFTLFNIFWMEEILLGETTKRAERARGPGGDDYAFYWLLWLEDDLVGRLGTSCSYLNFTKG